MRLPLEPEERRRADRLLRLVIRLLKSSDWRLRYVRFDEDSRLTERFEITARTAGLCRHRPRLILVDPRRDTLSTIVHECLHALHPAAPEDDILDLEDLVMRRITPAQAGRLHLAAGAALGR